MGVNDKASSLSRPEPEAWAIYTTTAASGLYSLAIVDIASLSGFDDLLPPSIDGPHEFRFKMNPKSLDLDEPAACVITPTQKGLFIENQGQLFKNISIAGTTGLRPNRTRPGGITPVLGYSSPDGLLSPGTGLPRNERTGFDDLIDLRNMFRNYWDLKTDLAAAPRTVMVWQNGKEGEFYVVEPISFRTRRDAQSPLTFSYDIQLRTISRLENAVLQQRTDPHQASRSLTTQYQRLADANRVIKTNIAVIQEFVSSTATLGQAFTTAVLAPLVTLSQGLAGLIKTSAGVLAIPRNSLATLVQSILEACDSLSSFQDQTNAYKQFGIMTKQAVMGRYLRQSAQVVSKVTQEDIFDLDNKFNSIGRKYTNIKSKYRDPVTGSPKNDGSPLMPANIPVPGGSEIATVNHNEDIRQAAARLLGDAARWRELVLLNNLRSPYLSAAGNGTTVLRPDDTILIPATGRAPSAIGTPRPSISSDPLTERLGRDIMLIQTGSGGGGVRDFALSSSGDIATIEGLANMSQAMQNRLDTEPGDLPTHPLYGFSLPVGEKVTFSSITAYKLASRASLLADSRVSDVAQLSIETSGNVAQVRSVIQLAGVAGTQDANFTVRR